MKKIWNTVSSLVMRYPAIAAAVLIYGYYLFSTIVVFRKSESGSLSGIDLFFQYDSLILLWVVAYLFIRAHEANLKYQQHKNSTMHILAEAERSEISAAVLNDVVKQIQDKVNNPLTVIASQTDAIRRELGADTAIGQKLDHIDALLQRIHTAIKDVAAHQSQALLENLQAKIRN
jgi:hypothetical protein